MSFEQEAKTVCERNMCAGCMVCVDLCPVGAIKVIDDLDAYNAVIQEDKCIHCNACHRVCQSNRPAALRAPINWFQGWTKDSALRMKCSSGGFATEISAAFIRNGGIVCSCTFIGGNFKFVFAEAIEELEKFAGSKYVKSSPEGAYIEVQKRLQEKDRVLFIGLPCQVAALKNFLGEKLQGGLYTIDLICHGTPSPMLLEDFLNQYEYSLPEIQHIKFREKAKFFINVDNEPVITRGVSDKYSLAFLNALSYTENCYHCAYAQVERVSDLTLGDSWGSELDTEEQRKGVSLVLCQTSKGLEILKQSDLQLMPVDLNCAIQNNIQLQCPSQKPNNRDWFFRGIKNGESFNSLVYRCLPRKCFRQDVKEILLKMKIIRRQH